MLNQAAIMAARAGRDEIVTPTCDEGHLRVLAGPEALQMTLPTGSASVVAWHEAGHALAAELCQPTTRRSGSRSARAAAPPAWPSTGRPTALLTTRPASTSG